MRVLKNFGQLFVVFSSSVGRVTDMCVDVCVVGRLLRTSDALRAVFSVPYCLLLVLKTCFAEIQGVCVVLSSGYSLGTNFRS